MAKVTMPLLSGSASGKIADALVFMTSKGRNIVRQFVIPANPQTTGQGDARIIMGGIGRAVGKIEKDKDFANALLALGVIPSGQSKQSYLVKFIKDTYIADASAYGTLLTTYNAHTAKADFAAAAVDLGIVAFDLDYATVEAFPAGLGVYLIAKAAIALGFATAPYTTALASWTATEIDAMVLEMTTVA